MSGVLGASYVLKASGEWEDFYGFPSQCQVSHNAEMGSVAISIRCRGEEEVLVLEPSCSADRDAVALLLMRAADLLLRGA